MCVVTGLLLGELDPLEPDPVEPEPLVCVLTGFEGGAAWWVDPPEPLVCVLTGRGAAWVDPPEPAPEPLVDVRGALAIACMPRGGEAPAAGLRARRGCGGFSWRTIRTVRRITTVRTTTGGAGGKSLLAGCSAKVVSAPRATSVIAAAIVVGSFRSRMLCELGQAHCVEQRVMRPPSKCKDSAKLATRHLGVGPRDHVGAALSRPGTERATGCRTVQSSGPLR